MRKGLLWFGILESVGFVKGKGLFGSGAIGWGMIDLLEGGSRRKAKLSYHKFIIKYSTILLNGFCC